MATIAKESIGHLHEKISVILGVADYLPAFEKSLKSYVKKANIQGFRPGKVPAGMIKKMYGASLFAEEVLRVADAELNNFLELENIDFFAQPIPAETTDFPKLDMNHPADYTFDFEIALKPDIDLSDFSKINIKNYEIDITEEMINKEIEDLQDRFAASTVIETVNEDDDIALNVIFEKVDADDHVIDETEEQEISIKKFSEKTRKKFYGKKANDVVEMILDEDLDDDEKKDIDSLVFLDKDDESEKVKKINIMIIEVNKVEKSELNEAFFEKMYPAKNIKTIDDFKAEVKDEINRFWTKQSRNETHHQLLHSAPEHIKIEFPEAFLRRWLIIQNTQDDGTPTKTEEQIDAEMPNFLNQLKWSFISDKIVKDQNLSVLPDEVKAFAKQQMLSYMGNYLSSTGDDTWAENYANRMLQDRKYVTETYNSLQSEKIFDWAEKQVNLISTPISAEDFMKMIVDHNAAHHAHESH